jgi:hypothetical protein
MAESKMVKGDRVTVEKVTLIQLTLDEAEAEVLYGVLRRVGGPSAGPRGKVDSILGALATSGVKRREYSWGDGLAYGGANLFIKDHPFATDGLAAMSAQ